eukprot:scaffold73339_cov60-Phaeocystis_antarctica.AAC.6
MSVMCSTAIAASVVAPAGSSRNSSPGQLCRPAMVAVPSAATRPRAPLASAFASAATRVASCWSSGRTGG